MQRAIVMMTNIYTTCPATTTTSIFPLPDIDELGVQVDLASGQHHSQGSCKIKIPSLAWRDGGGGERSWLKPPRLGPHPLGSPPLVCQDGCKHLHGSLDGGWVNRAYSRLSTTHGHITDCKLDSVVYAGVCVVI